MTPITHSFYKQVDKTDDEHGDSSSNTSNASVITQINLGRQPEVAIASPTSNVSLRVGTTKYIVLASTDLYMLARTWKALA